LIPTGGCSCQKMSTVSLERRYLCIWYPLELSDVRIRIIEVTSERSSSSFDGQIVGDIVLSMAGSNHQSCESCRDQRMEEHSGVTQRKKV
jgi:hypothetical protein